MSKFKGGKLLKIIYILQLYFVLVWSAKGHSSIINAIDGTGGTNESFEVQNHEVVTGSRDGSVKVIIIFCLIYI